jgi:hypothetical protein
VFRLWLENLNWVSNTESGSGPTPKQPPVFAEFLRGIRALEALQERGEITLVHEEREEAQGSPLTAGSVSARDLVEAAKNGYEYRQSDRDKTWTLIKKQQQTVMKVRPDAIMSPEMLTAVQAFHLKPGLAKYEVDVNKLDPYPVNFPPEGETVLDLETRSLLQVLYFISKGVDVPLEHFNCGRVTVTADAAGQVFDCHQVTDGLFRVYSVRGHKRPPNAHVAIRYLG